MEKLNSHEVIDDWQVETMRKIYNQNLDMLATRPLPYREYQEQQEWWNNNKQNLRGFLYEPKNEIGNFVAFLVLTNRGLFDTPIIAISKNEWGSGYGQEIVNDYLIKSNRPLAGSQLQSNKAICHINKKVGWQIVGERIEENGIVDLLYHPGINTEIRNTDEIINAVLKHHNLIP